MFTGGKTKNPRNLYIFRTRERKNKDNAYRPEAAPDLVPMPDMLLRKVEGQRTFCKLKTVGVGGGG